MEKTASITITRKMDWTTELVVWRPTLSALRAAITNGQFHLVLTAPRSDDARAVWIQQNCLATRPTGPRPAIAVVVSYCLPTDG